MPRRTPIFQAKSLSWVASVALTIASAGCESSATTSVGPSALAKCQVAVTGGQLAIDAAGGAGSVTVSAEPECAWTVSAAANWISGLNPASGQGGGEIKFQVAPNPNSAARQTDISLNGATAKVTQAGAPCRIDITPRSQTVPASGGAGTVTVKTSSGCSWTATSNASWLTAAAGGTGTGTLSFAATANAGAARIGNLTIGDQTFVVTQQALGAAECTYTLQPGAVSIGVGGGPTTLAVRTGSGCSWTAASNASWLTIGGSATGIGNGSVTIHASANAGTARTGTLTIAEQTFTVTQAAAATPLCAYAIEPSAQSMTADSGSTSVTVQTSSGCSWTATSNVSWLTVGGTGAGVGSGGVTVTASANTGVSRTGTVTIAGQTFTVTQAGTCTSTILPTSQALPASGGIALPVAVASPLGCDWTATTTTNWLSITSGASGTGIGVVAFSVAANTGPARTGTISIAGQTHTVNQASGCAVSINPSSASPSGSGGDGAPIGVSAGAGCPWTATTATSWITVTSGTPGTGNGSVGYTVGVNTGAAREGTISIATNTFTVSQGEACSYSIDPTNQSFSDKPKTSDPVSVTAPAGCAWTSTSNDSWIIVKTGAAGTGNGTMTFSVSKNDGSTRVGTLTIAGLTFTVTQADH